MSNRGYILLNLARNIVQEADQSQHWPFLLSFKEKINFKSQEMIMNSVISIKRYFVFGKYAISLNFRIIFLRGSIYILWFFIRLRKLAIYPIRKFILFLKGNNLNIIYVRVTDFYFWYIYNSANNLSCLMHIKKRMNYVLHGGESIAFIISVIQFCDA